MDYKNAPEEPQMAPNSCRRPTLGLALGGGGILGLAHVGILETLQSAGLAPDVLTGTSIGALVAGCYGGGMPLDDMKRISLEFSWRKVRKRKVIPTMAVYSSEPMREYLEEILPKKDFDSLAVPVAMVATDLRTAQMVVLGGKYLDEQFVPDGDITVVHANMVEAIRASCTVPVLFEPVELGGRTLVDGFLTNNVPAGLARKMGSDVVVAVDLQQRKAMYDSPSNIFEYIMQSQMIYRYWAVKNRHIWADVVIRPILSDCGWDDASRIKDIMVAGREAALEKVPEIRKALAAAGKAIPKGEQATATLAGMARSGGGKDGG
jgi:NTE family protein